MPPARILYSAEKATWMAGEAIQALGGMGYINETPTGRLWRDAKAVRDRRRHLGNPQDADRAGAIQRDQVMPHYAAVRVTAPAAFAIDASDYMKGKP